MEYIMRYTLVRYFLAAVTISALLIYPCEGIIKINAADSWISLTELPMKNWTMLSASSTDVSPAYSPGINRMKSENGVISSNHIVINAKHYEYGIASHVRGVGAGEGKNGWTVLEYDISALGFDTFSAVVGKAYASSGLSAKAQFAVYVDGNRISESPIIGCTEDFYLEADISGGNTLSLVASDGGDGVAFDDVAWGNPVLYSKNDIAVTSISIEGASYIIPLGGEIDMSKAIGLVIYDCGIEKKVDISEINILGFDASAEGAVSLTLQYNDAISMQEFCVAAEDKYAYLSDMEMDSFTILEGKQPIIDFIEDRVTPINLRGVSYSHGIWTHPTSNAQNNGYAELVWDIGDLGYTRLRVTVGKPNDTYMMSGMYHIYLDGKLLESSPLLYAGCTYTFDLDIRGGDRLALAVTGGEEGADFYYWDSTAWADPVVWTEVGKNVPIKLSVSSSVLWVAASAFVALMFVSSALYVCRRNKQEKRN